MKYDAFISYRHAPLDMEIAKKLHKGLETFQIPLPVQKKTGKKKISRVFRDQEELPIGADLTEKISSAIRESEYLIVICSKETPQSYWVQKEIETFIEMHDRAHALAILIDGEPGESFPELLLTDEDGNPVEPLAADVRGETKAERNKKFKTELLRLAAPIIGCSFDDLRQRHRERIVRKVVGIVAGIAALVAAAGISFGLYNANVAKEMEMLANEKAALADEKTQLANDILAEYNEKLMNQSRFYAAEALTVLEQGDRRSAALIAAEAIPTAENGRPYVPEAEYALSRALHAYDTGLDSGLNEILPHDMQVNYIGRSADSKYLITIDDGQNVYVWDVASCKLKVCIRPIVTENNYVTIVQNADADDSGVYVTTDDAFYKFDYEGNEIWHRNKTIQAYVDSQVCDGIVILSSAPEYVLLDAGTGAVLKEYEYNGIDYFTGRFLYDHERQLLVCACTDPAVGNAKLDFIDLSTDEIREAELSDAHFYKMYETSEGEIAVMCGQPYSVSENSFGVIRLDLYTQEGERLWSVATDMPIRNGVTAELYLKAHTYEVDGEEKTRIVFAAENLVYSYDAADGSLVSAAVLQGDIEALMIVTNSEEIYAGYYNGNIDRIYGESGKVDDNYALSTVYGVKDILPFPEAFAIRMWRSADVYMMNYLTAPDIEELPGTESRLYAQGVSASGDYYMMCDPNGNGYYRFYDKDGNVIYGIDDITDYQRNVTFVGEKTYVSTKYGINIIDPRANTREYLSFEEMGAKDGLSGVSLTSDGAYAAGWMIDHIYVFDLAGKSRVADLVMDTTVGRVLISEDGQTVYYVPKDGQLRELNVADGSNSEFPDEKLRQFADAFSVDFMTLSPSGTYLAMSCCDGYVRLVDLSTKETFQEIPLLAIRNVYEGFSSDEKTLILQGDDGVVRVWDISGGRYVNSIDVGGFRVSFIVDAPEQGHLAVCTGYDTALLETQSYAQIADVPYGVVYLPGEGYFIQQYSKNIYRTHYKDATALLEELARQFPGEALTDAEKAAYNID